MVWQWEQTSLWRISRSWPPHTGQAGRPARSCALAVGSHPGSAGANFGAGAAASVLGFMGIAFASGDGGRNFTRRFQIYRKRPQGGSGGKLNGSDASGQE